MIPQKLAKEIAECAEGERPEVQEDAGMVNLVFENFPTSPRYNNPTTTLLLRVPMSYPDAGIDMFWTDVELQHADGTIPQAAESLEPHGGKQWRRFSWHHNRWNPNVDNLHSYLQFVKRRFHAQ